MSQKAYPARLKQLSPTQIFCFVCFGVASGLPFLMLVSTLVVCLTEKGISPTSVGFSTLVTLPYTFKFFLSPLVDKFWLPFLSDKLGQRKCCAFVCQLSVVLSLAWLGITLKSPSFWQTGTAALCVSLCATLQDLVLEVCRIEQTPVKSFGISAWATTAGFRLGVLISGAGALYAAHFLLWSHVYQLVAFCALLLALPTLLLFKENLPHTTHKKFTRTPAVSWSETFRLASRDLFSRHFWPKILLIFCFAKMVDVVLHTMGIPFLLSLGYTKTLYATYAKFYGFFALLAGSSICGLVLDRLSVYVGFVLAFCLQLLSALFFCAHLFLTPGTLLFASTILCESLASGFLTTLLVAYMSRLVRKPYTTAQYGMLASLSSVVRIFWGVFAGVLVSFVSWKIFFIALAITQFVSLFIFFKIKNVRYFLKNSLSYRGL